MGKILLQKHVDRLVQGVPITTAHIKLKFKPGLRSLLSYLVQVYPTQTHDPCGISPRKPGSFWSSERRSASRLNLEPRASSTGTAQLHQYMNAVDSNKLTKCFPSTCILGTTERGNIGTRILSLRHFLKELGGVLSRR